MKHDIKDVGGTRGGIGLFLFGNFLPRMAHSLGMTVGEFRRETRSLEEDISLPSP